MCHIKRARGLLLAAVIMALAPVLAQAQAFGAELGYLSVPVARADPYSFAASAGLWYEHALGKESPLVGGAWLAASGFRSLDPDFGDSLMCYGGLELGYTVNLLRDREAAVSLRPLARLGWYARSIKLFGSTEWGSRPFISAGCILDLKLNNLDLGLTALLSVPMDNKPVLLIGVLQRVGLCF
jgi:hypothetical protein